MNSILEFLLDMILDWDDIEDYTQYHHMSEAEQQERNRVKSSIAMFHESVGPQMWAETQKFTTLDKRNRYLGIQDVPSGYKEDTYSELDWRQHQESMEPGAGERAADKALEADLYRIGY
jgi:hypothetical protein